MLVEHAFAPPENCFLSTGITGTAFAKKLGSLRKNIRYGGIQPLRNRPYNPNATSNLADPTPYLVRLLTLKTCVDYGITLALQESRAICKAACGGANVCLSCSPSLLGIYDNSRIR
ncbi:unnamed protein product [Ectocarpus fasciculatus]